MGHIHHTLHPGKVLEECAKYAGPETTLKLMVYNRYSWKVLWILLKYGGAIDLARTIAKYSEAQTGCPVTHTYNVAEIWKMVYDAGFRTTSVQIEHIFPYKIPEYTNYQYKKVWYFRWIPGPVFRWLERRIGWHLCLTAVKR